MLNKIEAEHIARQYLLEIEEINDPLVIVNIRDEPFGWLFFYQTKEYVETQRISAMLAGNAPFVVDNKVGDIHVLGTALPIDDYLAHFK